MQVKSLPFFFIELMFNFKNKLFTIVLSQIYK